MDINKWAANDKLGQLALALIKIRDQDVVKLNEVRFTTTNIAVDRKCMDCDAIAFSGASMKHISEPMSDGADNPCFVAQQALLVL